MAAAMSSAPVNSSVMWPSVLLTSKNDENTVTPLYLSGLLLKAYPRQFHITVHLAEDKRHEHKYGAET